MQGAGYEVLRNRVRIIRNGISISDNFEIDVLRPRSSYVNHSSNIQGSDSKSIHLVASHDLIVCVVIDSF